MNRLLPFVFLSLLVALAVGLSAFAVFQRGRTTTTGPGTPTTPLEEI